MSSPNEVSSRHRAETAPDEEVTGTVDEMESFHRACAVSSTTRDGDVGGTIPRTLEQGRRSIHQGQGRVTEGRTAREQQSPHPIAGTVIRDAGALIPSRMAWPPELQVWPTHAG
jgi:hypothetical protein